MFSSHHDRERQHHNGHTRFMRTPTTRSTRVPAGSLPVRRTRPPGFSTPATKSWAPFSQTEQPDVSHHDDKISSLTATINKLLEEVNTLKRTSDHGQSPGRPIDPKSLLTPVANSSAYNLHPSRQLFSDDARPNTTYYPAAAKHTSHLELDPPANKEDRERYRAVLKNKLLLIPKLRLLATTGLNASAAPDSNFEQWSAALLNYLELLHAPLKTYLLSFRTIDISRVNSTLELPAVPSSVSVLDAIEAQTAILGSVGDDTSFLVNHCGQGDFSQAYFAILKFLAPNVKTIRTDFRANFYANKIGDECIMQFGAMLHGKAVLHNSTVRPGGSIIQIEEVLATLLCGIKGCERYDKARGLLMSMPDLGYQATIDILARNSDESACHAARPPAQLMITANAVSARGRGRGRGGKGGGKGSRAPVPTPLGQGWDNTLTSTTNASTITAAGTDDRSKRPCISTFLNGPAGKCPRLEKGEPCPYNHNFTVSVGTSSSVPLAQANAVGHIPDAQHQLQQQLDQLNRRIQEAEQKIPEHLPQQLQSFSTQAQIAHGGFAFDRESTSYNPRVSIRDVHDDGFHDLSAHSVQCNVDVSTCSTTPQKMPSAHQKNNNATVAPLFEKMPSAHKKNNATVASLFPLLFAFLLFVGSSLVGLLLSPATLLFNKLNSRSSNPNFFKYSPPHVSVTSSSMGHVSTPRAILEFLFLPLDFVVLTLFHLTMCPAVAALKRAYLWCRRRPHCPNGCSHHNTPTAATVQQGDRATAGLGLHPRLDRSVMEDSGCNFPCCHDRSRFVGPLIPCKTYLGLAEDKTSSVATHKGKIRLNGKLVDALYVPTFTRTLISQGWLFRMGYIAQNNSGGRKDYVDANGKVWLSFHIAHDNLYFLIDESASFVVNAAS